MNTKKLYSKVLIVFVSFILSVGLLSGCTSLPDQVSGSETLSSETSTVTESVADSDLFYNISPLMLFGNDYEYITGVIKSGDNLYALANRTTDNRTEFALLMLDMDGNVLLTNIYERDDVADTVNYSNLVAAPDGNFYVLKTSYIINSETGVNTAEYDLLYHDKNLVGYYALDIDRIAANYADIGVSGVRDFEVGAAGNAYFLIGDTIVAVDIASQKFAFDMNASPDGFRCERIVPLADGTVGAYGLYDKTMSTKVVPIDPAVGGYADMDSAPAGPSDMIISTWAGICYSSDNFAVYASDLAAGTRTKIIDLLGSGLANFIFDRIIPINTGEYIVSGYNIDAGTRGVYRFTQGSAQSAEVMEKVTVGMLSHVSAFDSYLNSVNKNSRTLRGVVKDYSHYGDLTYDDALIDFNLDVLSGDVPDVLLIDERMPYRSYVKKGLFADLAPIIAADTELQTGLVQPVIDALTTDGKLFSIPAAFSVHTLSGKAEVFGGVPGLSLTELQEKAAAVPGARLFDVHYTRSRFVDDFIFYKLRTYIDYENGISKFNTPEFMDIIEYAKSLPEDWSVTDRSYDFDTMYMNNNVLLNVEYLSDFRQISYMESWLMGGYNAPVTLLGFPAGDTALPENDSGSDFNLLVELAISSDSGADAESAAWELVRGMLYYEVPGATEGGGSPVGAFPILQSKFTDLGDYIINNPVLSDNPDDQSPNNTIEDNAQIYDLIAVTHTIRRVDTAVCDIISDDLTEFWSGKKTAAETAAMIDDRVKTYLSEQN